MDLQPNQNSGPFAYLYIIIGFAVYYAVEGTLKLTCLHFRPEFYAKLKRDERFLPFFGFAMGWLITVFSTPICLYAFVTSKDETPLGPSLSGQICIASRSILWVSELNRLEYLSVFVKHHFGSLTHLTWHLHSGVTMTPLYLIYASLVTELFSTAAAILTIAGLKSTNSPLARKIQQANTIAVPLLRTPPVIYVGVTVLPQVSGMQRAVGSFFLIGYLWSFLRSTPRELRRLGMMPNVSAWKNRRWMRNPFGTFASAAYWALVLSTLKLYTVSQGSGNQKAASFLLFQGVVAGFIGARSPSLISEGGNLLSPTGYWVQSGALASGVAMILTPFSSLDMSERRHLVAAAAVSLLLVEAVGRIGCHFAGCCGSSRCHEQSSTSHKSAMSFGGHISVPLLASFMSQLAYVSIVLSLGHFMDLYQAAAISVALHGFIRLVTEMFRGDTMTVRLGFRPTVAFAGVEVLAGMTYFLLSSSHREEISYTGFLDANSAFPGSNMLSLSAVLAGLTQACAGSGMESMEMASSYLVSPALLLGWMTQACAGSGMESIEIVSALPALILGVMIQACAGSGMEAIDTASLLTLVAPVFLSRILQACSSGGMEAVELPILTFALANALLWLLPQSCSTSRTGWKQQIPPKGGVGAQAGSQPQRFSFEQSSARTGGGMNRADQLHCGHNVRV